MNSYTPGSNKLIEKQLSDFSAWLAMQSKDDVSQVLKSLDLVPTLSAIKAACEQLNSDKGQRAVG